MSRTCSFEIPTLLESPIQTYFRRNVAARVGQPVAMKFRFPKFPPKQPFVARVRSLILHLQQQNESLKASTPKKKSLETSGLSVNCKFWTSDTALFAYFVVLTALFFQRVWIMHVLSVLLCLELLKIMFIWTDYILDDPDLKKGVKVARGWIQRFLKEGERIVKGKDAIRLIIAGTMLKSTPTGISYFRAVVRYKTSMINREYLADLLEKRKGYRSEFFRARFQEIPYLISDVRQSMRKRADLRREAKNLTPFLE